MNRVALKIGYIGTKFHGFQRQSNVRTVEEELLYHLTKLNYITDLKTAGFKIGGRTDKGVHSLGNVISFITDKKILINQINTSLPDDIWILAKTNVPFGFRPRYAEQRHYKYILPTDMEEYPLDWFLSIPKDGFDIKIMKKAANYLKGENNFINFSKRNERHPIRIIDDIIISKTNSTITVDIYGESFLWNMVRKIMKALLEIANHKNNPDIIKDMLNPDNNFNIRPMPAENLILMDIKYNNINFTYDEYASLKFNIILKNDLTKHKSITYLEESMINTLNNF